MVMTKFEQDDTVTVKPAVGTFIAASKPILSKDNQYLVCCSGHDIRIYSTKSGELIQTLYGHTDDITSVVFNPNNQFQIISSSADGTLKKWDIIDCIRLASCEPKCNNEEFKIDILSMYPIPDDPKELLFICVLNQNSYRVGLAVIKQTYMFTQWSSEDIMATGPEHISLDFKDHYSPLVSIGGQSSFVAICQGEKILVFDLYHSRRTWMHSVELDETKTKVEQCLSPITCISAHPQETTFAVGHEDGKINIWCNVMSKKAFSTYVHWHSQSVLSLSYTAEGSHLLSGGYESVLVKWQHGSPENRNYLPRLGAPINHIITSDDNTFYVTSHLDNSIKLIRNWLVVKIFSELTRDYLSSPMNRFRSGIRFDPRSHALVLNGLPGHLQFYSTSNNRLLYNLDVVGQNYVTSANSSLTERYTQLEHSEFSPRGDWLVTVERWAGSSKHTEQCRMKFWNYDQQTQTYVLNTDVDRPHRGGVSVIRFNHYSNDHVLTLVSTGSSDNKFKVWSLQETHLLSGDIKVCWGVEFTGYYKQLSATDAHFSHDNSILAISFHDQVTLWSCDGDITLCTVLPQSDPVRFLRFITDSSVLAVMTDQAIILTNLLDFSEVCCLNVKCNCVTSDPDYSFIVVIGGNTGYFITSEGKISTFSLPASTLNSLAIQPITNKSAQVGDGSCLKLLAARLYMSTCRGAILKLVNKSDLKTEFTPTIEEAGQRTITANYQQQTPLAVLLNSRTVRQGSLTRHTSISQHSHVQKIVTQIGETACIAMPSVSLLCRKMFEELLVTQPQQHSEIEDMCDGEEMHSVQSDSDHAMVIEHSEQINEKQANQIKRPKVTKADMLNFTGIKFERIVI